VRFLKINLRFFKIGAQFTYHSTNCSKVLTAIEQTNARHTHMHTHMHTHIQGQRNEIQTRDALLS